jgi:hypothetical protein
MLLGISLEMLLTISSIKKDGQWNKIILLLLLRDLRQPVEVIREKTLILMAIQHREVE